MHVSSSIKLAVELFVVWHHDFLLNVFLFRWCLLTYPRSTHPKARASSLSETIGDIDVELVLLINGEESEGKECAENTKPGVASHAPDAIIMFFKS
jgi:hypothetical protein